MPSHSGRNIINRSIHNSDSCSSIVVHGSFGDFSNFARRDINQNLPSKERPKYANDPPTSGRETTHDQISSMILAHVSSPVQAFSSLRELATDLDYVQQCLPIDLSKLLEVLPSPPKVPKIGSEGFVQDSFTLK